MSRFLFVNPPVLAVDPFQVGLYAEALPFGLLQIATHFLEAGHAVDVVDMMGYLDGGFERGLDPSMRYGTKPIGDATVGARRDVFLYGRSLAWLDARLDAVPPPDEVFVTCCISFNYEPAHAVIRRCRERFPSARIRFGGFYPSIFPDHARTSGCDEVHVGPFVEAERVAPRLDLLERTPPLWIFRLVLGCKYRCSYCINALYGTEVVGEPEAVADELVRIRDRYGVTHFSNWDPNVMLEPGLLHRFLDAMIARGSPVRLKFEMGIQPDRLDRGTAEKMFQAGVESMTLPFESVEDETMKRFGKPYRIGAAVDAVRLCRAIGFDTRTFHCTSVVGLRDESWHHVFGTWLAIVGAGGLPTPFPVSFTPGTKEYRLHEPFLRGKDLSELNGHLWPAQPSEERVRLYDLVFEMVNQPDTRRAATLARRLPADVATAFAREIESYREARAAAGAGTTSAGTSRP